METKIGELIRQTDDIRFLGIYKEFLSFRRRHFVEYHLLKRIPLIESMMQTIEEEMDKRSEIEELAEEKVEQILPVQIEEENEEEKWKKQWKEENKNPSSSSLKDDFKKILLYVAAFHICIFGFFALQTFFAKPTEKEFNKQKLEQMEEAMYPSTKNIAGPISDSLKQK